MGSKITSNKSTPGRWSIGPPNVVPKLFSNPFEQNNSISQPTFAHPLLLQTTKITLGLFLSYSVIWWAISFFCSISPCLVDTIAVGKIIENVENLFDDSDDLHEAAWVDGLNLFGAMILLMEEIPHHLGCIKPCKQWDKLPTSTGSPDFWTINNIKTYLLEQRCKNSRILLEFCGKNLTPRRIDGTGRSTYIDPIKIKTTIPVPLILSAASIFFEMIKQINSYKGIYVTNANKALLKGNHSKTAKHLYTFDPPKTLPI